MSLRKQTVHASHSITGSAPDRLQQLYDRMNDFGFAGMTTEELEEWSYLMAESLEGKGDPYVPVEKAHTISTEGLRRAL